MAEQDPDNPTGGGGSIRPGSGGGAGQNPASGDPTMVEVLHCTVTLVEDGLVDVDGAMRMGFNAVPASWAAEVWVGGQLIWNIGGTYPGDVVPIGGILYCTKGTIEVSVRWKASTHVTLQGRYIKVRAFNNVSG